MAKPNEPTADQIARLPKWARDRMARLERVAAELRADLDQVKGADPRPAIAVRDPYGEAAPVAWSGTDEVRFFPWGADRDREWIGVRRRDVGQVEVSGSSTLTLQMQASNVLYVATEDYSERGGRRG